jgi:hypothetical protein
MVGAVRLNGRKPLGTNPSDAEALGLKAQQASGGSVYRAGARFRQSRLASHAGINPGPIREVSFEFR